MVFLGLGVPEGMEDFVGGEFIEVEEEEGVHYFVEVEEGEEDVEGC